MSDLDRSYRRILPLATGSNFRDFGDYCVSGGSRLVRGHLFRSASLYSITDSSDIEYLKRFSFKTVIDLRSNEERDLQPDTWVHEDDSINYLHHPYEFKSMLDIVPKIISTKEDDEDESARFISAYYRGLSEFLLPQLKLFINALLNKMTPVIIHCSGGQDRTGLLVGILQKLLDVCDELIYEDYSLSTDFRKPITELSDTNFERHCDKNAWAKFMLENEGNKPKEHGNPLRTVSKVPFLKFALDELDTNHGSVKDYVKSRLNLTNDDINFLYDQYIEKNKT